MSPLLQGTVAYEANRQWLAKIWWLDTQDKYLVLRKEVSWSKALRRDEVAQSRTLTSPLA